MKSRRARRPTAPKAGEPNRPAKVARARRLIADPDYPQPKVMRAVARLLAKHLTAGA